VKKEPNFAYALGFLTLVGALKVTKWSLTALSSFSRHYLRGTYDIFKRYATFNSWVVVTGGSDGIGLEICH